MFRGEIALLRHRFIISTIYFGLYDSMLFFSGTYNFYLAYRLLEINWSCSRNVTESSPKRKSFSEKGIDLRQLKTQKTFIQAIQALPHDITIPCSRPCYKFIFQRVSGRAGRYFQRYLNSLFLHYFLFLCVTNPFFLKVHLYFYHYFHKLLNHGRRSFLLTIFPIICCR